MGIVENNLDTNTSKYQTALSKSKEYFGNDELAAQVFLGKYALTTPEGVILEETPDDMHKRMAKEFARIESKYPNSKSEKEIYELFKNFKYIVPQGSPMSGIGNPYQTVSLSNCFVIESPYDSYSGICKTDQEEAQIMKRRGGVGFDISTIRPRGLSTSNAAKTTDGIGIFMERFSNTCREVAQGGRRGALMLSISVHHPEIETFINIKRDLKKVTGANISIRLSDEFMKAVKANEDYEVRFPVDDTENPKIRKNINAKQIWDQIIDSAWSSAEPGLLFWDTCTSQTPTEAYKAKGFGSVSTNPCITGDTLIAVADGRNAVSIKQLVEEGKDVPVYSTNIKTGQVEIKMGRNPRVTGINKEVWKLTLDDGSEFKATPNHKILLKNLQYVELKDLKPGDSIFPFYSHNSNGYRQISNTGSEMSGGARRNRRQYRLIAEFNGINVNPKTHAIHHINFNSTDDRIENLQALLHEEHKQIHSEKMIGSKNPYHKMTDEWKFKFASKPGIKNPKYSGHTNDELLEHGKKLFDAHGKLTNDIWLDYAKKNKLPQYLGNQFRFGSFKNFVNQVSSNHKVVSIEFIGNEDVYNITVDDNHNYHVITSKEDDKYITSSGICVKNCGEILLSPYDSCRLLLVNTLSFVENPFTSKAKFDYEKYGKVVQVAQRLMDDMIDLELECIEKIQKKIEADPEPEDVKRIEIDLWNKIKTAAINGRRTGLGVTAIGDTIAALNLRYGSEESVTAIEEIYKHLALNAYRSTVEMAKERGTFPVYEYDLEKDHPFINRIMDLDSNLKEDWKKYGRRNIALTTTAPAGSVSVLTQTTSGIEPAFEVVYKRRKKINPNDKEARVDFVDALGDKWQEYKVYHHQYKKWMEVSGKEAIEDSPYYKARANDIDWVAKVKAQAAAQKWICHSISNTTNVPNETSKEVVSEIYMTGWESGCKGVTVYRDGCRDGVLVTEKPITPVIDDNSFKEHHAPKRPKDLPCDIFHITVGGEKWNAFVGLYEDKPYEIFVGRSEYVQIPKSKKHGIIHKNGTYNLLIGEGDDQIIVKDLAKVFENASESAFTRTVSLALRHGVPVQYVVEQIEKGASKENNLFSLGKGLMRVLKGYIKDGTKTKKKCENCGSDELAYIEGCLTCSGCSHSKCG